MRLWVFYILLISGCGEAVAYTPCDIQCNEIKSSHPFNCRIAKYNIDMVAQGMAEQGIASQKEACLLMKSSNIEIRPESYSWDEDGVTVCGLFDPCSTNSCVPHIQVTRTMDALAHEVLHAYEDRRGIVKGKDGHGGWDQNQSYQRYLNQYENERQCSLDYWDNASRPGCWAL